MSIQLKRIPVCIPGNLDLSELIKTKTPSFKCNPDIIKFILNTIVDRMNWDKRLWETNEFPFTPLNGKTLIKFVHNYKDYINYLLYAGVIEQAPFGYCPGRYSKAYRLTEAYRVKSKDDFIHEGKFMNKIRKVIAEDNNSVAMLYPHLTNWFEGLRINSYLARQWADDNLAFELTKAEGDSLKRQRAYCKHANQHQSIDRINAGYHRFKVDDKGHRFHSSLTNLKSELRNSITYQNQRLVSVDLSNSQLFFLSRVLSSSFYAGRPNDSTQRMLFLSDLPSNIQEMVKPNIAVISNETIPEDLLVNTSYNAPDNGYSVVCDSSLTSTVSPPTPPPGGTLPMVGKFNSNVQRNESSKGFLLGEDQIMSESAVLEYNFFKDLVGSGTFYEHMLEEVRRNEHPNMADREWMKTITFTVLFSDESSKNPVFRKRRQIFRNLFPNIFRLLDVIKTGNSATLALLLQNVESELFLNRITRRIAYEKPDLPIFTIHDSVCTTVGNEAYVEAIMKEELEAAVGIKPSFKREYWQATNLIVDLPEWYPMK